MTRDEALARLRGQVEQGRPIIGAGAGTGLSAKLAEAGGADLIIIYNSGRYRMAGRGSLAGMMPYGDANAIVMDMAREVLPVVRETPCSRACAGRTPSGSCRGSSSRSGRGLLRRAELPDGGAHRRHLPRGLEETGWATGSRWR
jgi:predicted TIM-barrel enzyme